MTKPSTCQIDFSCYPADLPPFSRKSSSQNAIETGNGCLDRPIFIVKFIIG